MIRILNITKISQESLLKNSKRSLVSFKDMFGSKEKGQQQTEVQTYKENLISTDFDAIKKIETTRLVRVKAYKPLNNVQEIIKKFCQESFGKDFNEEKYQELSFSDPKIKFQVLTKCISIFKHNIPNPALNEIKNVSDLINYYLTEIKDTNPLEDLSQQPDLPKNLHINLEYNRFDPEKDKFFNGRDAYPERNTVVSSLWYSKKYKSVNKKKPYFSK